MKDKLKEILIHQLNECKITPMEYIEFNKYIDRTPIDHLTKIFNEGIAGAVQSRYPRAINNMQAKIDSLEQARVNNPRLTLKINRKIARLRAIQNKYRIKQQVWMVKANSHK
jgi:hypothetical protein